MSVQLLSQKDTLVQSVFLRWIVAVVALQQGVRTFPAPGAIGSSVAIECKAGKGWNQEKLVRHGQGLLEQSANTNICGSSLVGFESIRGNRGAHWVQGGGKEM